MCANLMRCCGCLAPLVTPTSPSMESTSYNSDVSHKSLPLPRSQASCAIFISTTRVSNKYYVPQHIAVKATTYKSGCSTCTNNRKEAINMKSKAVGWWREFLWEHFMGFPALISWIWVTANIPKIVKAKHNNTKTNTFDKHGFKSHSYCTDMRLWLPFFTHNSTQFVQDFFKEFFLLNSQT